jgi:hypothetical protein
MMLEFGAKIADVIFTFTAAVELLITTIVKPLASRDEVISSRVVPEKMNARPTSPPMLQEVSATVSQDTNAHCAVSVIPAMSAYAAKGVSATARRATPAATGAVATGRSLTPSLLDPMPTVRDANAANLAPMYSANPPLTPRYTVLFHTVTDALSPKLHESATEMPAAVLT